MNKEIYLDELTYNHLVEIIYSQPRPEMKCFSISGTIFYKGEKPKEEKLMTREEASKIINDNCFGLGNTGQSMKWAKTFEALGLIKFKEEKKDKFEKIRILDYDPSTDTSGYVTLLLSEVIKSLEEKGYTVRENG